MTLRFAAVVVAALSIAGACTRQPGAPEPPPYRPFYATLASPAQREAPAGDLKTDFNWAAGATTYQDAAERWRKFLGKHQPQDGEYEDTFQRNHVRAAQYELMRVEYVLGHVERGDQLLNQLEDIRGGG